MIYLDASAIVTRTLGRQFNNDLEDYLDEHPRTPLGTSTIGFVETVRTCDQFGSFPHLMTELHDAYTDILLTDEVRDVAAHMPEKVRTLDAIHIASAESLHEFLTVLVSYDERMLQAAHARGLRIAHPGMQR